MRRKRRNGKRMLALLLAIGCMLGGCGEAAGTTGAGKTGIDEAGTTEAGTAETGIVETGAMENETAETMTTEADPTGATEHLPDNRTKTYWTVTVGENEIALKGSEDPEEDAALYLIGADGSGVVLRELTGSAEQYHAETFSDLLAHDGFVLYCDYDLYRDWKYYALEGEELLLLAYSWGSSPEKNEYIGDIDGDGDRELVHFVTYMADGVDEVEYYDWRDGQAMEAVVEDMDVMTPERFRPEMLPSEKLAGLEFWQVVDW